MTNDELRALADALEPMARAPRFEDFDVPGFCAWVRACADAKPVAWRCEVRGDGSNPAWDGFGWRHYHTTTSEREALAFVARCGNGIEGRAVPLYPHPAPAAPQAEPMADSDADYWLRNRQPILDAIERAGFMLMSNASGFWLHPRGTTDAKPVAWRDHVEQRIRGWRQRTMNRSGDRLALDDMMGQESIDDLIDYVCDEWAAPAAPQAEPKCGCRACLSPAELMTTFVVCPKCGNKRCPKADDHRYACTGSNAPGQTPQAEPKREPLTDEQIANLMTHDPQAVAAGYALMRGVMSVAEFRLIAQQLIRAGERAHGIGGSDAE